MSEKKKGEELLEEYVTAMWPELNQLIEEEDGARIQLLDAEIDPFTCHFNDGPDSVTIDTSELRYNTNSEKS